ncbi:ribose 5-phosphate isomerase [Acaromyces ingoldii]|uniref:Ribose 5-phosphate isomerase n=1 Tax=Acaromyces ingoldii TaxID=215250 RepID=A0A316YML2_9BASI|nr:ribose 5-phosphate isomerase [Acaromyces ingoldii]PWN90607.1 ribose 5-phosphate isomerase [Acaromyces ingoldii]
MSSAAPKWKIIVANDDAAVDYKKVIIEDLKKDPRVELVDDFGAKDTSDKTPYPNVATAAAEKVAAGQYDRGLLLCGTGLGVAISACKVPGIRAACCHDPFSVERSILSNDCQILTMGQRVIGIELARNLVKQWLGHVFDPQSASAKKVAAISEYEKKAAS